MIDTKSLIKSAINKANDNSSQEKSNSKSQEVFGSSSDSYSTIKPQKKKKFKLKDNLDNWTCKDFAVYILRSYRGRYGNKDEFKFSGVVHLINQIKDSVENVIGYCDNIVLKSYIDFYFERHCDSVRRHKIDDPIVGTICLRSMKNKNHLFAFADQYDYRQTLSNLKEDNFEERIEEAKKEEAPVAVSNEELNAAYLLGDRAFILKAGLILGVHWLADNRGFSTAKAVEYVERTYSKLNDQAKKEVLIRTRSLEPYSDDMNSGIEKIDNSLKDIKYVKDDKLVHTRS